MPTSRPWHSDSIFGDGPRRVLDRDQRARFNFLLNAHARARRLPAKQEKVGRTLLKHLSQEGRCDPSHQTLADTVGCCTRTVQRACDTMKRLGLLVWQHRLVRDGWRTAQTSNAYILVPAEISADLRCGGQNGRQTIKQAISLLVRPKNRVLTDAQEDEKAFANRDRMLLELARTG